MLRSTAENGSSSSSTRGSRASARATATRCCCPPESSAGRRDSRPFRFTRSSSARARAGAPGAARDRGPPRRSPARSCAGRARSSGTRSPPSARAARARHRPWNRTRPRPPTAMRPAARADDARDAAQHGRLAAARRADKRQHFARRARELDLERDRARLREADLQARCRRAQPRRPVRRVPVAYTTAMATSESPSSTADMTPAAALSNDCTLS